MEPTDGNSTETARWEFFLADEHASEEGASPASKGPFSQLAATECMAQSGEIILSREAAELATPHVLGVPLAGGAVRLKGVRQDALSAWRPGEEGLLDVEELAKKENQDLADLTPAQRVEAYKVRTQDAFFTSLLHCDDCMVLTRLPRLSVFSRCSVAMCPSLCGSVWRTGT